MDMDAWLDMYPPEDKDKNRPLRKTPPVSAGKLKKMQPQRSLDLHGLTAAEARSELSAFLSKAKSDGLKKVLIIHGKGYHSAGKPVLKDEVVRFLERCNDAGTFGTAPRDLGGSGATWVLIK